jgi:CheY-like chemotaxis protein
VEPSRVEVKLGSGRIEPLRGTADGYYSGTLSQVESGSRSDPEVGQMTLILVVEDDLDSRESLAALLRSGGYAVATAANGHEAHQWLINAGELPSIILLDLIMPVMDGWHFRWYQVQDVELAQIPIVVLSGESDVREAATALGAAGYLSKPIDLASLLGTLQRSIPPDA